MPHREPFIKCKNRDPVDLSILDIRVIIVNVPGNQLKLPIKMAWWLVVTGHGRAIG